MDETRREEYSIDNISKLMTQEELGLHISLVDSGKVYENGKPIMNIVLESDMNQETVANIMKGLIDKYEEELDE